MIRGRRTEDREQKTEDRGRRTEARGQKTEDRRQRTGARGWTIEKIRSSDFRKHMASDLRSLFSVLWVFGVLSEAPQGGVNWAVKSIKRESSTELEIQGFGVEFFEYDRAHNH